jgi:hypothetical protein
LKLSEGTREGCERSRLHTYRLSYLRANSGLLRRYLGCWIHGLAVVLHRNVSMQLELGCGVGIGVQLAGSYCFARDAISKRGNHCRHRAVQHHEENNINSFDHMPCIEQGGCQVTQCRNLVIIHRPRVGYLVLRHKKQAKNEWKKGRKEEREQEDVSIKYELI